MKHLANCILLGMVIFFTHCGTPQKKTFLSGELLNPVSQAIEVELNDTTLVAELDSMGRFMVEIPLPASELVIFSHGDEWTELYLVPGQHLKLSVDAEAFGQTLQFPSGDEHHSNKYLAAKILMDTVRFMGEAHQLDEADFLSQTDQAQERLLGALEEYQVSDNEFKAYIRQSSKWEYARIKIYYKFLKERDKSFRVSDSFLDFQQGLDINDTTNLKYDDFETYVDIYLNDRLWTAFSALDSATLDQYYEIKLSTIQSEISAPKIKQPLLFDMIRSSGADLKEEMIDEIVMEWRATEPDPESIQMMEANLAILENTKPGKPAPAFNYLSYEGDSVSLASLAGKLVYIDVWATWCGPCIAEHPALEKLQEDFASKDVAFVSVSIDESTDPWRKMIEEKELNGVQLYTPGQWQADIMEDYGINSIPRFILIDQQGKIVDANTAKPSSGIGKILAEHLKI